MAGLLRRLGATPRRFARNRTGVTLVEFALVAPIFFLLLFSIIEIALISFSQSAFKTGAAIAAREIRTGLGQCLTRDEFVAELCSRASFAPSCTNRTTVDVERLPSGFGSLDNAVTISEFQSLSGGDVVLMRTRYEWQLQSPLIAPFFDNGEGALVFQKTLFFKTENYAARSC